MKASTPTILAKHATRRLEDARLENTPEIKSNGMRLRRPHFA